MKSIRKTLTRRLSIVISLLVIVVLLAADIGVDSWVESEFNQSLRTKVGMLQSLVNEDVNGVEFDFAGEYFPEFEGTVSPEYFQLWYQGVVFEKSNSLSLYKLDGLPFKKIDINETFIDDFNLPDGRSGRIIYTKYIPQIDTKDREAYYRIQSSEYRQPIVIAYATSTELLNFTLWFIDIAFIVALIVVPLAIRFAVRNTVSYALAPLDSLNEKISSMRFATQHNYEAFSSEVDELKPIVASLNHFIQDNYSLYLREKRLTSDIAHELKTPVSELITMTEVAMQFPGEDKLEKDFKPHILRVGTRMKNIISGLMFIQKYSGKKLDLDDEIDLLQLIKHIVKSKDAKNVVVSVRDLENVIVTSNRVAVESIISNLLNNALEHGKASSPVKVTVGMNLVGKTFVEVSNKVNGTIKESDIKLMFEPLWQKDSSRSSQDNFGLGLSIVNTLSEVIGANVVGVMKDNSLIAFTVTF